MNHQEVKRKKLSVNKITIGNLDQAIALNGQEMGHVNGGEKKLRATIVPIMCI